MNFELEIDDHPTQVIVISLGVSNFVFRVVGHILNLLGHFPFPINHTQSIFRNLGLSGCFLDTHRPYTHFGNSPTVNFAPHTFFIVFECPSQLPYVFLCQRRPKSTPQVFSCSGLPKIALGIFLHRGLLRIVSQTFLHAFSDQFPP